MSTEQTPALAFGNFINTCRSPATRAIYQKSFALFHGLPKDTKK